MAVDLSVVSDKMLDGMWADLLDKFAAARDACDHDREHELHADIERVVAEFGRRTDAWILHHAETASYVQARVEAGTRETASYSPPTEKTPS